MGGLLYFFLHGFQRPMSHTSQLPFLAGAASLAQRCMFDVDRLYGLPSAFEESLHTGHKGLPYRKPLP